MVLRGQDAWRKHPLLYKCWRNPFPGLLPAAAVFSAYVAGEYAYKFIKYGPPPKKVEHH